MKLFGLLSRSTIVLLVLLAATLLALRAGERMLLEAALERAGVEVVDLQGSLLTTLRARRLRWASDGTSVSVDDLLVDPELAGLLFSRLRIARLELGELVVARPDAADDPAERGAPASTVLPSLPVRITLEELVVRHFELTGPLVLQGAVEAGLTLDDATLNVDGLTLRLDDHPQREALGAVGVVGDGRWVGLEDWQATARLTTQRLPEVVGGGLLARLDAGAGGAGLTLGARIERPLALRAQLRRPDDSADVSGEVRFDEPLTLRAGEIDGPRLDARGADPVLASPIAGSLSALLVEFDLPGGDPLKAGLTLTADAALADPLREGAPTELRTHAKLRREGDRYRAETLRLAAPGLSIEAPATADLATRFATVALRVDLADARHWLADRAADGTASADITVGWGSADGLPSLRIDDLHVDGKLDAQPLALSGNGSFADREASGALEATLGVNRLQAKGTWMQQAEQLTLEVDAALPELAQLDPTLAGAVQARARLEGALSAPIMTISASSDALSIGGLHLAAVSLEGSHDANRSRPLDASLVLRAGAASETLPLSLRTALQGSLEAARLSVDADLDDGATPLQGAIGLSGVVALRRSGDARAAKQAGSAGNTQFDALDGTLERLGVRLPGFGAPDLERPAVFGLRRGDEGTFTLTAEPVCLASGDFRLCSDAIDAGSTGAAVPGITLTALPLGGLDQLLPPDVAFRGALNGRFDVLAEGWQAGLDAAGATLAFGGDGDAERFFDRVETFALTAKSGADALDAELILTAGQLGSIELQARVAEAPDAAGSATAGSAERALSGHAELTIGSLAPLGTLVPELDDVDGSLRGTFDLSGTLAAPRLSGRARGDLNADLPAVGRRIDLGDIRVDADPGEPVRFGARLAFDDAAIDAEGTARLPLRDETARLDLTLRSDAPVQVVALPDLALWLRPELVLAATPELVDVGGRLEIPRARVRVAALPSAGSRASPDVVIHGEQAPQATGPRTRMNVDVAIGDDVQLTAGSLRTGLVGALNLTQAPARPLLARGRIETRDGVVQRFGRELVIEQGRLAFDGPVARPLIDVTATRALPGYSVGVVLTGTPDTLATAIYSSPTVDDLTAMTMLVTGRPPSEASREDASLVRSAAVSLGLGAASPVLQGLGERFGLTELGIDGDLGTETGAVVAGRRISDRLYARYNYALESGASGLSLEYQITERLSARTASGAVHALDLLYRRDFD